MFPRKIISFIFIVFVPLVIWSCGSSAEYTSAKMAIEKSNWAEAEEYLFKALEVEPANAEVMVQIGYHVHAKKREWTEMNKMFNQAIDIDPSAKVLGRPVTEITKNYRSMFWAENYNKAIRKYNESRKSQDKPALQSAADLFNETLAIDPNEAQTYSILANCYYELGDSEKAVENAKKAHELMPNEFRSNYTLGQILALTGQKENAIKYIEKAVEIEPNEQGAVKQLAGLYYETGLKEKSIETFELAIKQEPDKAAKANLYFNLGVLHMQSDNFQDAEDNFMMAYDLNPSDTEALIGIAQTFENAEKWRRASKFYRELISLDPENPEHYKGMARTLIKQGDPDGATRYLQKAKKVGG